MDNRKWIHSNQIPQRRHIPITFTPFQLVKTKKVYKALGYYPLNTHKNVPFS